MPPPDRGAAHAAAEAIGVPLDDAQADRLLAYLDLLQRWNATYNLTALRDPAAMWLQHVVDCMAAVPAVRRALQQTATRPHILDVGSGGGLPGIVWAVLMPEVEITCVDTVGKKVAFIRQAAGALPLPNLLARHGRVEQIAQPRFDLIASRAFASLVDFTRLTRHLLADGGSWVAMKGKPPTDELAALGWPASMFHVEPLRVPGLDAERCLVWLKSPPQAPQARTAG
jgi:16S rRNA (guanine527-N7)-methyltransferase